MRGGKASPRAEDVWSDSERPAETGAQSQMSRMKCEQDGVYRRGRPALLQDTNTPTSSKAPTANLSLRARRRFLRAGSAADAAVGTVWRPLWRAIDRWRVWREKRRTLAELARMDDRSLEDIGLHRILTSTGGEVIISTLDDRRTSTAGGETTDDARGVN